MTSLREYLLSKSMEVRHIIVKFAYLNMTHSFVSRQEINDKILGWFRFYFKLIDITNNFPIKKLPIFPFHNAILFLLSPEIFSFPFLDLYYKYVYICVYSIHKIYVCIYLKHCFTHFKCRSLYIILIFFQYYSHEIY